MASGWRWIEWSANGITSSDVTPPSLWLSTVTTPSLAPGSSPVPRAAMIECAETPGATGVFASAPSIGLPGRML